MQINRIKNQCHIVVNPWFLLRGTQNNKIIYICSKKTCFPIQRNLLL